MCQPATAALEKNIFRKNGGGKIEVTVKRKRAGESAIRVRWKPARNFALTHTPQVGFLRDENLILNFLTIRYQLKKNDGVDIDRGEGT